MEIIKNKLTLAEVSEFVENVIDNCFSTDKENGIDFAFSPEYRTPALQKAIARFYYGYKVIDNGEKDYDFYTQIDPSEFTNFLTVGNKVNMAQFNGILESIDMGIEFRKQQLLQSQQSMNMTVNVVSKLDDVIENFANTLAKTVEQLPKNIDTKSIQPFMEKINEMANPDMKDVVKTIVKANKPTLLDHLTKKKFKKEKVDKVDSSTVKGE